MFENSALVDKKFLHLFLSSLYLHGIFIFTNPEKNWTNNHNHYLSDLAGQIFLGMLFKGINFGKQWLHRGLTDFYKEIRIQILPTGASYERSTNYHRLVTEIISYTIAILIFNKQKVPDDILYRLRLMFSFIKNYTRPDGEAPIIGDHDDGRFLPFTYSLKNNHRYLLSLASILFKDENYKNHSAGFIPECYFLINNIHSKQEFDSCKGDDLKPISTAFKDAGFYIMRDNNTYLFINISGLSHYNEINSGTHTHSDLLSFELIYNNISFIIDPGSYVYSKDKKERKKFRSTMMHNTATVDGMDQHIIFEDKLWWMENNAIPNLINWESSNEKDIFEAEHSGYMRLPDPVNHKRKIVFEKLKNKWQIKDNFTAITEHEYVICFHFDIGVIPIVNKNQVILSKENEKLKLNFSSNKGDLEIRKKKDFISKGYAIKKEAWVVEVMVRVNGALSIITNING